MNFSYVCLFIVIPCGKIQTHIISKLVYGRLKPSHSMAGRWTRKKKSCKTRHAALAYAHQVTAQSSMYPVTPEKELRKDPWLKTTLDQILKQMRRSSGSRGNGTQICTLIFKSTVHPWKHKRVRGPMGKSLTRWNRTRPWVLIYSQTILELIWGPSGTI